MQLCTQEPEHKESEEQKGVSFAPVFLLCFITATSGFVWEDAFVQPGTVSIGHLGSL